MADEVKPEVVEASANPEVVESSTTTTTSTTVRLTFLKLFSNPFCAMCDIILLMLHHDLKQSNKTTNHIPV